MDLLNAILNSSAEMLIWMAGFFVVFGIGERLMPCNPGQSWFKKAQITDVVYFLALPILTRFVQAGYLSLGIIMLFHSESPAQIKYYLEFGFGPLSRWPVWVQAAVIFLVSDFILYWTHRWFHGREMWRFHAIHHSPTMVDWHSTYRFHPVNVWLTFTLVDAMMLIIGFSPESVGLMGVFNLIYSAMVHANLNWTFGPFRYLFSSPVFHRWHHTSQEEGMDKNFAPTFPLLDIIFGTFYMPEGELPQHYGTTDKDMPHSFFAQMAYPFKNRPKK